MMIDFECFACDVIFESAAIIPCPNCNSVEDVQQFDPSWWDYDGYSDVEADADTLASAGWGTDEDYGYYGEEY